MPAIKLRVPRSDLHALGEGPLSQTAKAALTEALTALDRLPAPDVPSTSLPSDTVTVWVSADQVAQLEALAVAHQIDGPGIAATALLHVRALVMAPALNDAAPVASDAALTVLDSINAALGDATREHQARYFGGIHREVRGHRPKHEVVFAEAATGLGKTRAFEAIAIDWLEQFPTHRVAITAPSYNVLLQSIAQWQRIASVLDVPASIVIVGQQEFVSQAALERTLHEHPDTPGAEAARAWAAAGGPAPPDDPIDHRWLLRSLRAATSYLWSLDGAVVLDSDTAEDDPGRLAYDAQFAHAHDTRVMFCTHAMLAVDVRRRIVRASSDYVDEHDSTPGADAWAAWEAADKAARGSARLVDLQNDLLREWASHDHGKLPPIDLLIVDEAHLLESSFASVFAQGASMARLSTALRKLHEAAPKLITRNDVYGIDDIWKDMRTIGAARGGESIAVAQHPGAQQAIEAVRELTGKILEKLGKKQHAHQVLIRPIRRIHQALDVAAKSAGERRGMSVRISWSPSVHWPSIEVGRYDVSRELDFMWEMVIQERAIVVSATLFDDISLLGIENMRRTLGVRANRARPIEPVRPPWLYEPVTLHLVGKAQHADGAPRLRRPTQRDRLDPVAFAEREARWRQDVAEYVVGAHRNAAGGMLVLLTAHSEREALLDRLRDQLDPDLLLTHHEGISLERVRLQFLERIVAGVRPILLGVGAAWTGLDLSGDGLGHLLGRSIPAAEDNVLTDLVVPIAPIGVNRSLTHEWRRERSGMVAEIAATVITSRQGFGRLVRREGLPRNRRLHFLDSRIHEAMWNPLLAPVLKALAPYSRRIEV